MKSKPPANSTALPHRLSNIAFSHGLGGKRAYNGRLASENGVQAKAVMSGRRPVVKGCFEAVVNVSSAVMSTAC